jgi:alpha 1,2-mannosyltransferase
MNINNFLKKRTIIKNVSFDDLADSWSGQGVVMISGGLFYLSNAYLNIRFIRNFLKSNIPIEVWYLGKKEINKKLFQLIQNLGNVEFINVKDRKDIFPMKKSNFKIGIHKECTANIEGWRNKSYAILHSKFKEIIYLDSDCFLFQKPEDIFTSNEYIESKAMFSSDIDHNFKNTGRKVDPKTFIVIKLGSFSNGFWDYSKTNPIWEIIGVEEDDLPEFDSGFIVLDKSFHRDSIFLSWFLNENSDLTYQHIYGDKDTFHLAWAKTNAKLHMLKDVSRENGHILCRFKNSILFEHRVFNNKFNCKKSWNSFPNSNDFTFKEIFKKYFKELKENIFIKLI